MLSSNNLIISLGIGGMFCTFLCVLFGTRYLLLPRPIPGIPYRKRSAQRVLGDAQDILKLKRDTGEMWSYLRDQAIELDSPIIQVFMRPLGKPWVVVTDFRESQDIQVNRQHEFDRSKLLEEVFRPALPGSHAWMPTGDEFRAHRWLIRDTMSSSFLRDVVSPAIHDLTGNLISLWQERARLAEGRAFEVSEDIVKNVVDIIIKITFGIELGAVTSQLDSLVSLREVELPPTPDIPVTFPLAADPTSYTLVRTIVHSLDIAFKSPFPKQALTFALKFFPALVAAMKWKENMMTEQIEAARKKLSPEDSLKEGDVINLKSAIDMVIQREIQMAERENRPVAYNSRAIRDELFGFFAAGHETTSTTISWAVKRLTHHQDIQFKLRAALRRSYPRAVLEGTLPRADEIVATEVPYLDAFIQEIHRVSTTIPSIVRMATSDVVILGRVIPKGTDVFMMNNGPSFQSPAFDIPESQRNQTSRAVKNPTGAWDSADIAQFKPERWLVRGEGGTDRFDIRAGPSIPFGSGTRACFGIKLATLKLRMLITMLVWSFVLNPVPEELAGFEASDINTHRPQKVYLRPEGVGRDDLRCRYVGG